MRVKIGPVVPLGLLLTSVCLGIYISDCALARRVSNAFQDTAMAMTCRPERSHQVAIVELDERSLAEFGQWPWPRHLVANLTTKILARGATVVAFDVLFAEPDRTSPACIEQDLKRHLGIDAEVTGVPPEIRDFDRVFADAVRGRNVILGCLMTPEGELTPGTPVRADPHYRSRVVCLGQGAGKGRLPQAGEAVVPLPVLGENAHVAFFNAVTDADNIVRRNPLVWSVGALRIYPALALETVRLHRNAGPSVVRYDDNGIVSVQVGGTPVPVDLTAQIVINFRATLTNPRTGLSGSFPSYSAAAVLRDEIGAGELGGRIVLIGASAGALMDVRAMPFARRFSGVEVHATMIDNILAGDALRSPGWLIGANALAVLLVGVVLTVCIARGRSWVAFLVAVSVLIGSVALGYLAFTRAALLFLPSWSIICVGLVYPVLTTCRYWEEERQKRRVREMFGTMVSRKVLSYLENHPENFSLRGEKTEATVFFSDVKGFTTISEALPPERLTELLRRYLSPMTDIVMRRDGYVDKFEGDAIMAVWGVPFAMPDHAVRACLAAIEQQECLIRLRPELEAEFGHALHVRIGINTGVLTAGNMGARDRFQYTVMGDTVNQAARLEPANKDYGTLIAIGESTREAARDHIETRLLDKLIVMGKTRAVHIYELVGRKGEVDPRHLDAVRLYEEALALHWKREWARAFDTLGRALDLIPTDRPSLALLSRIRAYIATPPPDDWQGEYRRLTKD